MDLEHRGDLEGGRARMPPDVVPAVPERLLPVRCGGVVTVLVPPLILGPVPEPPVELHDHAVVPVEAIAASLPAVRTGERRLPDRLGQPVRPLYVTVVAILKHRMVSAGRGADELLQVSAPAQLRTLPHRGAQPFLVGQLPRECAGNPAADIIKAGGGLSQVEHRLLNPGPRRIALPQDGLQGTP